MEGFFGWNLPMFIPERITKSARYLNDVQCMDIFNRITNIALSRFKWNGLPDSCMPEALEETLYFYGRAVFFEDPDLGFIHTPVQLPGPFNIYYESIRREAYSFGPYKRSLSIDDSVLIRANKTMSPDYLSTWVYTPKIANCLRAIDVHTETLKRPYMIKCQEKEKTSVRQAIKSISDNDIALVGDKFGDKDSIQVLNLGSTSNLSDMWANVKNYFNQCFNSLGVKNNYTEKRERMITTEAEGEGNSIRHVLEAELSERKEACRLINDMFGLNVSVEANELETFTDEMMEIQAARVTGIQTGESSYSDTGGWKDDD